MQSFMLEIIFQFLSVDRMISVKSVCKQFRDTIDSSPLVKASILNQFHRDLIFILEHRPEITSIEMQNLWLKFDAYQTVRGMFKGKVNWRRKLGLDTHMYELTTNGVNHYIANECQEIDTLYDCCSGVSNTSDGIQWKPIIFDILLNCVFIYIYMDIYDEQFPSRRECGYRCDWFSSVLMPQNKLQWFEDSLILTLSKVKDKFPKFGNLITETNINIEQEEKSGILFLDFQADKTRNQNKQSDRPFILE